MPVTLTTKSPVASNFQEFEVLFKFQSSNGLGMSPRRANRYGMAFAISTSHHRRRKENSAWELLLATRAGGKNRPRPEFGVSLHGP
jgi:hypothetical protein